LSLDLGRWTNWSPSGAARPHPTGMMVRSGPGWRSRSDREYGGEPLYGVDVLEIRDGKIVRETIYVSEPFDPPDWRQQWRAAP